MLKKPSHFQNTHRNAHHLLAVMSTNIIIYPINFLLEANLIKKLIKNKRHDPDPITSVAYRKN